MDILIKKEYDDYVSQIRCLKPDRIIAKAYQTTIKTQIREKIHWAATTPISGDYKEQWEDVANKLLDYYEKVLVTDDNTLLSYLYEEYKFLDFNLSDDIEECILDSTKDI